MLTYNLDLAKKEADLENNILSIGERKEHTLHRVIKYLIDPTSIYHEVPIDKKIVDICIDRNIYEIQTKSFNKLRDKLDVLLPNYYVTIVYPLIINKTIIKLNKDGEVISKKKSPKKLNPLFTLTELYKIKFYLKNPNLKIKIILLDADEFQQEVNKSFKYRHGKVKIDQVPTKLLGEINLEKQEDYFNLVKDITNEFTQKEFNKFYKLSDKQGSFVLSVLKYLDVVVKSGNIGRAYLYKIKRN